MKFQICLIDYFVAIKKYKKKRFCVLFDFCFHQFISEKKYGKRKEKYKV